ncbi:hypothetical protein RclHR1_04520009 [Rhizophagus clarus]|uniref:Uncharacterized protein n=1 Tax=Rhizophagus clarus TaxID=94130 RepID=A0A2Z6RI10_9GLOM|nr:hypothetical protein RclHR1_04520009 [Rhizophagus clarus]GES77345.1 hypothetical protein RCL_e19020_RclHR1_04520009 [Rhizophagus clarus]
MDSEFCRALEIASKQTPDMENLGDPMHQSDTSMNFDVPDTNSVGSLDDVDDELLATPPHNITPIPVTPLTKSQKWSAKKKARKKKKKALQLQSPSGLDKQTVPTFSAESSEYTPSKPFARFYTTFNSYRQWKEVKTERDKQLLKKWKCYHHWIYSSRSRTSTIIGSCSL